MNDSENSFSCFINVSNDSITEVEWIVGYEDFAIDTRGNGYGISVVILLLFFTALPWNLFIICAVAKKRLFSQPIIMLMLNLAITNLLVCILVMPLNFVTGIAGEYIFGGSDLVRCRVCQTGVIVIILPWISVHTLCLMSIDRFIYLKMPLKYNKIVTPKRMFAIIIGIWILCTLLALPPLFGFGEIKFSYAVATCAPYVVGGTHIAPNYFYVLLLLAEVILPIVTLFVMYFWVMCIIRSSFIRRKKRHHAQNKAVVKEDSEKAPTKSSKRNHSNSQLRLAKLFGAIFTANLLTWFPMIALVVTAAIAGASHIPTLFYTIAYLSYLSETTIHPIVTACLLRDLKASIYEVHRVIKRTLTIKLSRGRRDWNIDTIAKTGDSVSSNNALVKTFTSDLPSEPNSTVGEAGSELGDHVRESAVISGGIEFNAPDM